MKTGWLPGLMSGVLSGPACSFPVSSSAAQGAEREIWLDDKNCLRPVGRWNLTSSVFEASAISGCTQPCRQDRDQWAP